MHYICALKPIWIISFPGYFDNIFIRLCISAYFEGSGASLSLLPGDKILIKLVGEDNSWFVSCRGERGESLRWQRLTSSGTLVNISTQPQDRVHSEQVIIEGLDLVFRSVEQGDEGEYICVQTENQSSQVQFDLVVVQPIDFGYKAPTQMVMVGGSITSH